MLTVNGGLPVCTIAGLTVARCVALATVYETTAVWTCRLKVCRRVHPAPCLCFVTPMCWMVPSDWSVCASCATWTETRGACIHVTGRTTPKTC